MKHLVSLLVFVVAVIHLLPVVGMAGSERLAVLYGVSIQDPNLLVLMRHRAVLFGILGMFFLYSLWAAYLQPVAIVGGLVSVGSFLALAWMTPGYNEAIRRVVVIDLVALGCLIVAGAIATVVS